MALTLALSLSSAAGLMAMAADDVTIQINGEELKIPQGDTKPFIENDRTLVPMRAIFEALNATVDWDDAIKTVTSYDVLSVFGEYSETEIYDYFLAGGNNQKKSSDNTKRILSLRSKYCGVDA